MNDSLTADVETGAPGRIALAAIPEGTAVGAHLPSSTGGFEIILVRVGDRVFGYHNECPHAGRRLDWAPGRFLIEKDHLVCAAHGAMFKLDSGFCTSGPCRGNGLVPVALRIEEGAVLLDQ
ncbi:MAG: Rieske 2Fe-2S domain-containing protein [Xanthomonadales bacterium]|nr:Rieske 2Fe-2S domain-containing protein [Xanthomonadales bacterium]